MKLAVNLPSTVKAARVLPFVVQTPVTGWVKGGRKTIASPLR